MPQRVEERAPADHAPAGVARRRARRDRVRAVRDRVLPALVPAGADRRGRARRRRARTAAARSSIEAPRGDIVDRNGVKLVTTKQAAVVQLVPSTLPEEVRDEAEDYRKSSRRGRARALSARGRARRLPAPARDDGRKSTKDEITRAQAPPGARAARRARSPIPAAARAIPALQDLYRRICEVIDVSQKTIHQRVIRGIADTPYSNVTIRTDVPPARVQLHARAARVLQGHRRHQALPAPATRRQARRAAVRDGLGDLRPSSSDDKHYKGIPQGTRIGQSGLEWLVRQVPARQGRLRARGGGRVRLAATTQRKVSVTDPTQGSRLRAHDRLRPAEGRRRGLAQAMANSEHPARAGAFVAMDPRNGAILAMGSSPELRREHLRQAVLAEDLRLPDVEQDRRAAAQPRDRVRAIRPAPRSSRSRRWRRSRKGLVTPTRKIDDPGHWEYGKREYQNAKEAVFGPVNVSDALKVSSDIFFFKLGAMASRAARPGIQQWARKLGFGRKTGIDLPGEQPGLVPDRKWRNEEYAKYAQVRRQGRPGRGARSRRCTSAAASSATWVGGDNVNLAVGQGDLQATPLQVAVAYSALANDGTIVRPHLGKAIEDGNGVPLQEFRPKPQRKIKFDGARPPGRARRPAPRRAGGEGHVGRRLQGLADGGIPGLWEDRHGRALPEPRPGVVRLLREGQGAARSSSSSPSRRAASAPRPPPRRRA